MYKVLTLKLYRWLGHEAIKIMECGVHKGWICKTGLEDVFPELYTQLKKGKEVKIIVAYEGDK